MSIVSDFDSAMMQPARSVPAVRRLGGGSIRLTDAGRPLRAVGRDAVVYELRTPNGRILALRCLLRPDAHRDGALAARYEALRADPRLEGLRAAGGPLPRDIHWITDGVALPGPDLRQLTVPLMAMERVPGRTLERAVDRLCREGGSIPLAFLADSWLATATAVEDAGFVHGDLAADNLVVRPDGTIALVDLDTAMWPSFAIAPARSEGTPAYAHPRGAPLDPARRDRFPALVLWASLRILARHPGLREHWGDQSDQNGMALLWSQGDLRRPGRAPLLAALDALGDEALSPLLDVVRRALRFSPDETPPLAEIADRLEGLGFPRSASSSGRTGLRGWRPPVSPAAEHLELSPAIDGADHGRSDALSLTRPRPSDREGRNPDASRTTTIAERERRRAAAKQLGAAIAARDTATAVKLWQMSRTVPESAAYAAAVHLLVSHDAAAAIDRAMRRKDDHGLIAAVAEAERTGAAPSAEARRAVRAARQRVASSLAMRDAIDRGDAHALAALASAGKLDCLGRLNAAQARAVERALAWTGLERALAGDDDEAIATAFDPALWREEGSLPPGARERLELARGRLRWALDIRAALRRRDGEVLRELLANAPPGAENRLTEVETRRIQRVSRREAAVARLERALRERPDREVVAALAEFESAGAAFPDVLDWAAVRGVVDRISLTDEIRAATAVDPPDTARLARLLPAARAALGVHGSPGEPDWAALEQAVLGAAHLARLRDAISADDDARIASAADPDPYGARRFLTPDETERVQRAFTGARQPQA